MSELCKHKMPDLVISCYLYKGCICRSRHLNEECMTYVWTYKALCEYKIKVKVLEMFVLYVCKRNKHIGEIKITKSMLVVDFSTVTTNI